MKTGLNDQDYCSFLILIEWWGNNPVVSRPWRDVARSDFFIKRRLILEGLCRLSAEFMAKRFGFLKIFMLTRNIISLRGSNQILYKPPLSFRCPW